MLSYNTIALSVNVLAIPLALFMLIMLLWHDSRTHENLFFGALLVTLSMWSTGALLARITAAIGGPQELILLGVRILDVGFTGSCAGLYLFTVVLSGGRGRASVRLTTVIMALLVVYELWIVLFTTSSAFEIRPDGTLRYAFGWAGMLLYLSLLFGVVVVTWQRRRKIKDNTLISAIFAFSAGILIELISPDLRSKSVGLDISAIAALVVSIALVRIQIIEPLRGRANQLRAVRDVGLAITSRVRVEEVLSTIAGQAAGILHADGAAIFLNQGSTLELAAVHNMPGRFRGHRLALGEGLAGQVAVSRASARIEDYRRDWLGKIDMPYARQAFGAVIAAPLIFADEVMGVLVVVEGPTGKRFDKEDAAYLDLLAPQAAVAIKNSRLFESQHSLTSELEAVNNKLETVLESTENPVLAINRRFEIIFANPAAVRLLDHGSLSGRSILDIVPRDALPANPRRVLREVRRTRVYTYELTMHNQTYLCNLGLLGNPTPQGYVMVLNDVSQLKEIDRIKNRMIHMTSHDLKNPLAAAMFHVELLQEEGEDVLTESMSADINTIWIQLQRMNRIISGILDLERVQSGTLTYEECAVDQLIQTALQDLDPQMQRHGIRVQTDIPDNLPTIPGNHHHLMQAINNVIENAVKFTRDKGYIWVKVDCTDNDLTIHIGDTGVGIAYDDQPRIFEQFFRGSHPGMEPINGSGLGLNLVKAVMDAHQGRVWLESEVNKGTVVHMMLPTHRQTALEVRQAIQGLRKV
ncbi:MAG: ATP-binding protein [Chloroflexota bacterium]